MCLCYKKIGCVYNNDNIVKLILMKVEVWINSLSRNYKVVGKSVRNM